MTPRVDSLPTPDGRSLATRIQAGFAVVLLLHVVVAIMGHFGQRRAQQDLATFDAGRRLAQDMLGIDRLVGDLRLHVQSYIASGNRGPQLRGEETYTQLVSALSSLQQRVDRGDADAVTSLRSSLQRYHTQFRAAVEDRQRRQRLVDQDLVELSERAAASFAAAATAATPAARPRLDAAGRLFLVAQNGAQRYLAHLDSPAMREAHEALAAAHTLVTETAGDLADGADHVLHGVLADFDRTLVGIVQSTRGYLHLVNVVLAAEAVAFLRDSAALREDHLARIDRLQQRLRADQERYELLSTTISLATILLGLLAGGRVVRLVVHPLRAITATLVKLTRGDRSVTIPGSDRSDEIGAMAAAAQLLQQQTERTTSLLAATERLSQQRAEDIAKLERSNRELDSFVNLASHDLRAPLRAIYTLTRWLVEDCGPKLPIAGHDHLRMLQRRVERMNRLLNDLQTYARANRIAHDVVPVRVQALLRDVVELVGAPDGFSLELRGEDHCLCTARVPLEQVMANLIGNAIRHHDRGHGRVEVSVHQIADGVEITVTDDGPGIPPQFHEFVFLPFKTLRSRDDVDSSGVGLAIVKKHVERHGGRITIESPVHGARGTTFRLHWPEMSVPAPESLAAVATAPAEPVAVG